MQAVSWEVTTSENDDNQEWVFQLHADGQLYEREREREREREERERERERGGYVHMWNAENGEMLSAYFLIWDQYVKVMQCTGIPVIYAWTGDRSAKFGVTVFKASMVNWWG